jgi:triosephosphate isomerase
VIGAIQVSLFRDKNEIRHMKDVKVTCTNISHSEVKLIFRHTSEILNKIVS